MRVTNLQLTKPQAEYTKKITLEKNEAINPETKKPVSVDFSKDLFALFDTLTPHKILKDINQISDEVQEGYVKHKLTHYYKVKNHYEAIRKFMREFTHTRLYSHLQSLNNPEKALEILLDMFSPPPPKPPSSGQGQKQGQQGGQSQQGNQDSQQGEGDGQGKNKGQGKQDNNQDQEQQQGGGKGKSDKNEQEQEQDQNDDGEGDNQKDKQEEKEEKEEKPELDDSKEDELSNTPPDPLMDLEKFKNDMPAMEEMLRNNVFDDEMMRNVIEQQAGIGHNTLTTVEGLAKNINKIARVINSSNYKILDVARKFDATEQYVREEEVRDVNFPEKDWRITNMKTLSDFPNILPFQFLYPNEIFDKMLMDKDLKVKQYQSRRKKKQVLYLLIDVSGSMSGARQLVATSIALAYIKKAIKEKSIYFFRHFDDTPFDLHKVTNEKEALKEINYLLKNPKSGGGTCIDKALRRAIDDINDPRIFKQIEKENCDIAERPSMEDTEDLYERADILIITDGEDGVSVTSEFLEQKKVVLHSFIIEGNNDTLKKISKTCQRMSNKDISKLVS
jgi:uncharacterized protein with von Willebrand factor type A (vWA) domain